MKGRVFKQLSVAVAIASLTAAMCGCSGQAGGDTGQSTSSTDTSASGESSQAADDRELVTLSMIVITQGNSAEEVEKVEAAINEILVEKYNTQIEYIEVPIADHAQVVNLRLATQESCDIFQGFQSYNSFVSNGYCLALDDYIDAGYFDGALEYVADDLDGARTNGQIYSIPQYGMVGGDYCFMMRKDILDDLGIDLDTVHDWDAFGDVLRQIKDAYPDITPLMSGNNDMTPISFPGDMEKGTWMDNLGTSNYLGVLMNPLEDTTVSNYYASDSFMMVCNYAYEWSKEGLVGMDDVSDSYALVMAGRSAGYFNSYSPSEEATATQRCGTEMVAWRINENASLLRKTNNTGNWSISSYCEYPERACEVLNEFYVNTELTNLLAWGFEGEDYVFENQELGLIQYPEGLDSSTVPYFMNYKFMPNTGIIYQIDDGTIDNTRSYLEIMQEFNSTAQNSLAFGFSFDSTPVNTQIAACSNVVSEYYDALLSGKLDPETEVPNFLSALEDAGINEIIEEKQAQLDAWLAEN